MPRHLCHRAYSQHRVAAIALYRALLSRCASAPLPDSDRASLHNAIRHKFRQNRKLQSDRQLGLAFRAGYEVLDHLDNPAVGDSKSTSALQELIPSLPRSIVQTPPRRAPSALPKTPSKNPLATLPPEQAVLNVRPFAKTSGPRHVPILAHANGIPFLRITKPQPLSLSRMIQQKLHKRNVRFDQKVLLTNYWIPLSKYEDEWDAILEQNYGILDGDETEEDDMPWTREVRLAYRANVDSRDKDYEASRSIAARMLALVDKETKLAKEEGQPVIRGRKVRPIRPRWLI